MKEQFVATVYGQDDKQKRITVPLDSDILVGDFVIVSKLNLNLDPRLDKAE